MKKNLLVFTILISMFSVVNVSQASANCTAENPCGTWAMLDSQGVVTNIIVCQASVCGSGTFAGQTVVPQVAPNPVTHDTTGTSGFNSSQDRTELVTYSNNKFTITENATINNSVTEIDNNTTTESSVSIPVSSKSFTYEDTINKSYSEIIFNPENFDESKPTEISVVQTIENVQQSESVSIFERSTASELQSKMQSENLNIILGKLQTILSLLGSWIK
jgi:hypothetical protein